MRLLSLCWYDLKIPKTFLLQLNRNYDVMINLYFIEKLKIPTLKLQTKTMRVVTRINQKIQFSQHSELISLNTPLKFVMSNANKPGVGRPETLRATKNNYGLFLRIISKAFLIDYGFKMLKIFIDVS